MKNSSLAFRHLEFGAAASLHAPALQALDVLFSDVVRVRNCVAHGVQQAVGQARQAVEHPTRMMQDINNIVQNLDQIARSHSAASQELAASMIELSRLADSTRSEIRKFSL